MLAAGRGGAGPRVGGCSGAAPWRYVALPRCHRGNAVCKFATVTTWDTPSQRVCDGPTDFNLCVAWEELDALPVLFANLIIVINDMIKQIMTSFVHCT